MAIIKKENYTTRLQHIELRTYGTRKALCIDWDNDRHQEIPIREDHVDGVILALTEMLHLLELEKIRGQI